MHMQRFPTVNLFGHAFGFPYRGPYGTCRCGAIEDAPLARELCPAHAGTRTDARGHVIPWTTPPEDVNWRTAHEHLRLELQAMRLRLDTLEAATWSATFARLWARFRTH